MQKVLIFIAFSLFFSCQKKEEKKEDNNFNRSKLLAQAADNIIVPALEGAYMSVFNLQNATDNFINNPTESNLLVAQEKWKLMASNWQNINMFNFGPAGEMGVNKSINEEAGTFPINTSKIGNYIQAKDTSFNNFDRDARGIYAIEFLLFGQNQNLTEIIREHTSNPFRREYLKACVNKLKQQIGQVYNAWNSSYSMEFKSNTGTDIGSSISLFYNEFLKSYEGLKNFKFGIPLGLRPGQTNPLPQNVEAYYSEHSLELAFAHWSQLKKIWEGRGLNGKDGIGFKEYLVTISGGNALIESTEKQMAEIDKAFSNIPHKPLSKCIQEDFEKVNLVHTEMQKHTRFFKSDLSSLIGIAITYSSGDGD
jgi:predicted lipoprotein